MLVIYNEIRIESAGKLAKLYFTGLSVRASTPISFAMLMKKLNLKKDQALWSNQEMNNLSNF